MSATELTFPLDTSLKQIKALLKETAHPSLNGKRVVIYLEFYLPSEKRGNIATLMCLIIDAMPCPVWQVFASRHFKKGVSEIHLIVTEYNPSVYHRVWIALSRIVDSNGGATESKIQELGD